MNFDNIVGNIKNKELLNQILKNGNISQSYMFIGQNSIGKKEFAKEFAKAILCLDEKEKPCNKCKSCIEFDNSNNPDFEILDVENENTIKIDDIRKVKNKILEKPIISNKKVYIINDSEKMTRRSTKQLIKDIRRTTTIYCNNTYNK